MLISFFGPVLKRSLSARLVQVKVLLFECSIAYSFYRKTL